MNRLTLFRSIGLALLALLPAGCRYQPDTPLCVAANSGDVALVRAALARGLDPNEKDGRGIGALHWAARGGSVDVIEVLVAAGADVDLRDRDGDGWTPLLHAVHKRQPAAVLTLLEAGAAPDLARDGGMTALIMAAGYGDAEIVAALLDHGADPRAQTSGGLTALWTASGGGAIDDPFDGPPLGSCFPDVIQLLRAQAPDLKLDRRPSTRVLTWLARSECEELIKSLQEG
jgi:ankyrin repeat protein